METMKEITVNINGMGAMTLFRATRALKDETQIGHDIVVTTGEDGVVYLTDLVTESVVSETVVCDGAVPACAVTPEQTHVLVVQEEDNALYSYVMPTGSSAPQLDKLLFRSTSAIRHVVCSSQFIAVADDDAKIKVLLRRASITSDDPLPLFTISGHSRGIKSIAIDPTERFLCSSSDDSTVRVFALDDAAADAHHATEVAVFKTLYRDILEDDVVCRCAWQRGPTRSPLLAVPTNQGVIDLFDSAMNWKSVGQLLLPIGKTTPADINVVAFSPNGMYVAAATLAKQVVVWSLATRDVLRTFKVEYAILEVAWARGMNALVVYHTGGKVAFVKDVIPIGRTPPQVVVTTVGGTTTTAAAAAVAVEKTVEKPVTKKRKQRMNASSFMDDEADDDGSDEEDEEDDDVENDNENRVEAIKASFGFGNAATAALDDATTLDDGVEDDLIAQAARSRRSVGSSSSYSPFRTVTEPFQPGSVQPETASSSSAVHLLAWTPIGEIETLRSATSSRENLVKVEFADKSRRGFKFNDPYLFTIASLGDSGAFFGVPRRARDEVDASESMATSSFVFYRPFESWASNSSWHLDLPDGEDAECVATASTFCAVATSLHCLRIYLTSGVAFALLRLPGRIVTMAAKQSLLAVVFQDVCGTLAFWLLRVTIGAQSERIVTVASGRLPLSPPPMDVLASHRENERAREDVRQWSTLTWLGFDDRCLLYAVDSFGCVQTLSSTVGWQWFPLGVVGNSLNKSPSDRTRVFVLGVVNDALLYFPLDKHATAPKLRGKHRPVPLSFALRTAAFPKTMSATTNKAGGKNNDATIAAAAVNVLWQNVRVGALDALDDGDDAIVHEHAEMDKALILMMKTACAADEPARVLDLAKCLHLEKSHQIAQKLAIHFGLRQLQSELYALYYRLFEAPETHVQRVQHGGESRFESNAAMPPVRPSLESKALLSRRAPPPPPRALSETSESQQLGDNDHDSVPSADDDVEVEDEEASTQSTSTFFTKSGSAAASAAPAAVASKPVERSVAPTNPFLKKPAAVGTGVAGANGSGGDDASSTTTRSGLGRLAKFVSPPPMKKRKAGWKSGN